MKLNLILEKLFFNRKNLIHEILLIIENSSLIGLLLPDYCRWKHLEYHAYLENFLENNFFFKSVILETSNICFIRHCVTF